MRCLYIGCLVLLSWLWCSTASAQIVNVQSLLSQKKEGLSFQLNGTADWRVGNVNFALFEGAAMLRFLRKRHLLLLSAQGGFGTKGDERFVARAFGHLRYRYLFLPWLGVETFGQIEYNEFWRLANRGLGGLGLVALWQPVKPFRLLVGTAYMFEYNRFSDDYQYPGGGKEKSFHRWSSYLRLTFQLSKIFSIQNTTIIQPSLENFADWRLLVDSSLEFKVAKWLAISISHLFAYRAIPPVGTTTTTTVVEPFDSSLLIGLKSNFMLWQPPTPPKPNKAPKAP